MLVLLRILLGAAFYWAVQEGKKEIQVDAPVGDVSGAFYAGLWVLLGILNALVWAPYFGSKISDPLTGVITRSNYVERRNYLGQFIRWLENRQFRRATLLACFAQGVLHPERPAAFVIGLKNAKPGSWLERIYAREVFRFENAQNCVQAYAALRRQGIDPGMHRNPDVNLVLLSLDRSVKPDPDKLEVPRAVAPPPLKRNRRIQLFDEPGSAPKGSDEGEPMTGTPPARDFGEEERTVHSPAPGGFIEEELESPARKKWRRIWAFLTGQA